MIYLLLLTCVYARTMYETLFVGSHDSGTYNLTNIVFDCNEHTTFIDTLVKTAELLDIDVQDRMVDPWAITQTKPIEQQLEEGIRYLDLRLAYGELNGVVDWYDQHSFVGQTIRHILHIVSEQAYKTTDAYIIQFYLCGLGDFVALNNMIQDQLGEYLWLTNEDPKNVDLDLLTTSKVMIITAEVSLQPSTFIWTTNIINETFPQTSNVSYLVDYNTKNINWFKSQKMDTLYKIAWVLTPDVYVIARSVFPLYPHSVIDLSIIANNEFIKHKSLFTGQLPCNILVLDNYHTIDLSDIGINHANTLYVHSILYVIIAFIL